MLKDSSLYAIALHERAFAPEVGRQVCSGFRHGGRQRQREAWQHKGHHELGNFEAHDERNEDVRLEISTEDQWSNCRLMEVLYSLPFEWITKSYNVMNADPSGLTRANH